jgi:hypothetical protein
MICSQKQFSLENPHKPQLIYLLLARTSTTMNLHLHLLLLASVFNLSSGFMAELKGTLAEEACTGVEYADFKQCVTQGATADSSVSEFTDFEDESFVNRGGDGRKLSCVGCPPSGAPRGTWCFTMCGSRRRRRLLEEATDTPNFLRRVEAEDSAVFADGMYTGSDEAKVIAEDVIGCLGGLSTNHPCLGDTGNMVLTVTL